MNSKLSLLSLTFDLIRGIIDLYKMAVLSINNYNKCKHYEKYD